VEKSEGTNGDGQTVMHVLSCLSLSIFITNMDTNVH